MLPSRGLRAPIRAEYRARSEPGGQRREEVETVSLRFRVAYVRARAGVPARRWSRCEGSLERSSAFVCDQLDVTRANRFFPTCSTNEPAGRATWNLGSLCTTPSILTPPFSARRRPSLDEL